MNSHSNKKEYLMRLLEIKTSKCQWDKEKRFFFFALAGTNFYKFVEQALRQMQGKYKHQVTAKRTIFPKWYFTWEIFIEFG